MNKAAIKKELRRSACEKRSPWQCKRAAFEAVVQYIDYSGGIEYFSGLASDLDRRTFFLLVAEAL